MKTIVHFVLLTIVLGSSSFSADRPNILFIAIDDQNDLIGHLGGHPMAKTPHLDKLAQRETSFLNAHCNAPLCNPSRTRLLLGLRPTTTGIYGLAPWFRTLPHVPCYATQKWFDLYPTMIVSCRKLSKAIEKILPISLGTSIGICQSHN